MKSCEHSGPVQCSVDSEGRTFLSPATRRTEQAAAGRKRSSLRWGRVGRNVLVSAAGAAAAVGVVRVLAPSAVQSTVTAVQLWVALLLLLSLVLNIAHLPGLVARLEASLATRGGQRCVILLLMLLPNCPTPALLTNQQIDGGNSRAGTPIAETRAEAKTIDPRLTLIHDDSSPSDEENGSGLVEQCWVMAEQVRTTCRDAEPTTDVASVATPTPPRDPIEVILRAGRQEVERQTGSGERKPARAEALTRDCVTCRHLVDGVDNLCSRLEDSQRRPTTLTTQLNIEPATTTQPITSTEGEPSGYAWIMPARIAVCGTCFVMILLHLLVPGPQCGAVRSPHATSGREVLHLVLDWFAAALLYVTLFTLTRPWEGMPGAWTGEGRPWMEESRWQLSRLSWPLSGIVLLAVDAVAILWAIPWRRCCGTGGASCGVGGASCGAGGASCGAGGASYGADEERTVAYRAEQDTLQLLYSRAPPTPRQSSVNYYFQPAPEIPADCHYEECGAPRD